MNSSRNRSSYNKPQTSLHKRFSYQSAKKSDNSDNDSMDYFRIMKEVKNQHSGSGKNIKKNSSPNNLTEKIYSINSEKLGKYYKNNNKDLLLYGSKKFDLLNIQRLVKEMAKYKSKVLKKINEKNKTNNAGKNYGFESCDKNLILTPLAQNEKDNQDLADSFEKKKFQEAERSGVVMRRIEYVHLLDRRDTFKKNSYEDDKKIIMLMIEAVDKIERNWLLYKLRKKNKELNEIKKNLHQDKNINQHKIKNKDNNISIEENIIEKSNESISDNEYQTLETTCDTKDKLKFKSIDKNAKPESKNKANIFHIKDLLISTFDIKFIHHKKRIQNIRTIYKSQKHCFYKKMRKKSNEFKSKKNYDEIENKLKEKDDEYNKIKSQLDNTILENKKLNLMLSEIDNEYKELKEKYDSSLNESENNKKENEILTINNQKLNSELNQKIEESNKINDNYNKSLEEKNIIKNKYDKLIQDHDSLNQKYNDILNNYNKTKEELDEVKNKYDEVVKFSEKNEQQLEIMNQNLENINKEKNDFINNNKLLIDKITNLNDAMDNLEKKNNEQNQENDIKMKEIINKNKKDMEEKENIIEEYKNKNNELIILKNNFDIIKKNTEDKDIELNNLKNEFKKLKEDYDIIQKEKENNDIELNNVKNKLNNKNDIINSYEKQIDDLTIKNNIYEKHMNDLKNNNSIYVEQIDCSKNKNNIYKKQIDDLKNKNNIFEKQIDDLINKNNIYEKQITDLKSQISENNKINEINNISNDISEKKINEYKSEITSLEKDKEELKNTINILEEINNLNQIKYSKLVYQSQNESNKLKKEKINLIKELQTLKEELEKEKKKSELESKKTQDTQDKYMKKILRLNLIIIELNKRMKDLYFQISFLLKNKFDKLSDIQIKLQLMILLMKNYLDKKIIFDKREFFYKLMKKSGKYRNKLGGFLYKEKKIEFLRENCNNNLPY